MRIRNGMQIGPAKAARSRRSSCFLPANCLVPIVPSRIQSATPFLNAPVAIEPSRLTLLLGVARRSYLPRDEIGGTTEFLLLAANCHPLRAAFVLFHGVRKFKVVRGVRCSLDFRVVRFATGLNNSRCLTISEQFSLTNPRLFPVDVFNTRGAEYGRNCQEILELLNRLSSGYLFRKCVHARSDVTEDE